MLITGLIAFMFLRKQKPQRISYARFARPAAQPTPWLNRADPDATFVLPGVEQQAAFAVSAQMNMPMQPAGPVIAMPTGSHKALTPTPPPLFNDPHRTISMPTGPQQAITPASKEADPGYMPGALQPITSPLPGQIAATPRKNPVSTSDMSPLPLDNFDLSQVLPKEVADKDIQWNAPGKEKEQPISFSPLIAPNVQDDPVLETIMRQAQMGLYALPNQDPTETTDSNDDPFLA
ncbi:hypothetical protein KDW_34370 [Dictyobacter vulcani]|uniref:Uncharacterized protein n=2 Tax=Dictyobacter vulcani TaxID=2607529 RepID=A0A5J4KN40_9CHLR|nr:hypothetical protein KDW_34370 [Dictyobacter vulcani]